MVCEIAKALNYIHQHKIAHRDIKAENILVRKEGEGYVLKVIDWGLGALVRNDEMNRRCGTPEYCAP
jgi:serine/threonine protein kinase